MKGRFEMSIQSVSIRFLAGVMVAVALAAAAPAARADAACPGVTYGGKLYCSSTISEVKATARANGARVVLQGVSVTAATANTVTVGAWEYAPCPPGYFCGALMDPQSLTVTWSGPSRPAVGTVVNLFGTTIVRSLKPVGYAPDPSGCYIDYC